TGSPRPCSVPPPARTPPAVRRERDSSSSWPPRSPSTAASTRRTPAHGGCDEGDPRARGLDQAPATGRAGLLLRAVPVALLSPLDRPRLRRYAHRAALLGGADEGPALTAVAPAALGADLCRFDLDTALVRVHQTLLEEAPVALLSRLRPLPDGDPTV